MPANPDNRRLPLTAPKIAAAQESVSLARERAMRKAGGCGIEAAHLLWQWTRQNTSLREAMIKVAVIAWTDQRVDAHAGPTLDGSALSGRDGAQGPEPDLWAAGIATPPPPAEIGAIANAIGAAATLRLVEDFAGQRLYVPRAPREGSTLAEAIGLQEALALATVRGGETIKVGANQSCGIKRRRSMTLLAG
jgi:hypothetical protein